jgi:Flp pilus assembly protein TadG
MSVRHRREEGAVAIMVAILLVTFMAAVALTVDVGGLYLRRRELVNGSDSAALSSARTCARGGSDSRFASPEEAADTAVRGNGLITSQEVSGTDITEITTCGTQRGHVSVQYTSQQALHFAPVLGFHHESPVTTAATASWGLGSNNPVPIVVSSLLTVRCPLPPSGTPMTGDTCAFWYDNDRLNGGNFAFLSLNPQGWDVPIDSNCSQAQSGGTSTLTGWIDGTIPASVPLNWTDPTYVCTDTGIRGVGGKNGPNSQLWRALADLQGQTRDFPINWEGPGAPIAGAPEQGTVYLQGNIDKYDIIGFASLTIIDVVSVDEAEGGVGNCETKNSNPISWTTTDQSLDLDTISSTTSGWQGCPTSVPADAISNVTLIRAKQNDPPCCTADVNYTYDESTHTITWKNPVPTDTKVSFEWLIDPNNGPCGQIPSNSSAMCVVTQWQGSTLDEDFPPGTDNNTVVRLCDRGYGTCLDQ